MKCTRHANAFRECQSRLFAFLPRPGLLPRVSESAFPLTSSQDTSRVAIPPLDRQTEKTHKMKTSWIMKNAFLWTTFFAVIPSGGATTIAVPGSPTAIIAYPATGKVYVTTSNSNTLFSEIDPASNNTILKSIVVAPLATSLAIDSVYGTVFEAGSSAEAGQYYIDDVAVLYGDATNPVPTVSWIIPMQNGAVPTAIAFNSSTRRLYIASATDQSLHILDESQIQSGGLPTWRPKVALGHIPIDMGVDSDSNHVYIATSDGNLILFDAAANQTYTTKVGNTTAHVLVSPISSSDNQTIGGTVYVSTDSGIAAVQSTTSSPPMQIPLPGQTPGALAMNAATGSLFIADIAHNRISVINAYNPLATPQEVTVGSKPSAIAVVTSNGALIAGDNQVYVANAGDNSVSIFTDPAVGANLITLPVRWCAIEGSAAASYATVPPAQPGEPYQPYTTGNANTDQVLLSRLRQATDQVWIDQAQIAFRAANVPHIPIIADENQSASPNHHLGDVETGPFNIDASTPAQECEMAWANYFPDQQGIIAVNVRQFVSNGTTQSTEGFTPAPQDLVFALTGQEQAQGTPPRSNALCSYPRQLEVTDLDGLDVTVIDANNYGPRDANGNSGNYIGTTAATTLAHEFGHSLLLGHGDGVDNDQNGALPPTAGPRKYDGYCDEVFGGADPPYTSVLDECQNANSVADTFIPIEDHETCLAKYVAPSAPCGSVMVPGSGCSTLRPLQVETARDAAKIEPGAVFPDAADPSGSLLALSRCNTSSCTASPDLVLTKLDIAKTPGVGTTEISLNLSGLIGAGKRNRYFIFLDTDNDPTTGCHANAWDVVAPLPGAEIAVLIEADGGEDRVQAEASLWRCVHGVFEKSSPNVQQTRVLPGTVGLGGSKVGTRIVVLLPQELNKSITNTARVEAIAAPVRPQPGIDQIPHLGPGIISLLPPVLPSCTVKPSLVMVGQDLAIQAERLPPNVPVNLFLADTLAATGATDASGHLDQSFKVPAGHAGLTQVSVIQQGTASNATCAVVLLGKVTPVTPKPIAQLASQVQYPQGPMRVGSLLQYQLGVVPLPSSLGRLPTVNLQFDPRLLRLEHASQPPSRRLRGRVTWDQIALTSGPPGVKATFSVIACPDSGKTNIEATVEGNPARGVPQQLPAHAELPIEFSCTNPH
jgi:DNA-binding beta-propeller fold protein YncE